MNIRKATTDDLDIVTNIKTSFTIRKTQKGRKLYISTTSPHSLLQFNHTFH